MSVRPRNRFRLFWLLALALALLACFWGLGDMGFCGRDDGRYAEIAREMLESGDWVTPRLLYVKYFEKPPLLYWLTALSFRCFGFSSFAGLLPCVLGAFATLGSLGYLVARAGAPTAGAVSVVVLATSILFFAMGRVLTTDMLLTGWYSIALASLYFVFEDDSPGRSGASERRLYVFALASGLAVLTKGLIGILLPVATGAVYALLRKRSPRISRRAAVGACGVWLAVVLPWFVLASARNPEFLHYFIVVQHVQRFLGASHEHVRPWWFFAPVTAAAVLPWTPFLLVRRRPEGGSAPALSLFLWVWAAVVFGFFSVSAGKLIPYVLPALPPLAAVIALNLALARSEEEIRNIRWTRWGAAAFWALLAVGAAGYAHCAPGSTSLPAAPLAGAVAGVCAMAALSFALWRADRTPVHGVLPAAGATAAVWLTLNAVAVPLEPHLGLRTMCLKAKAQLRPGDVTVLFREYCPGFAYYTARRPILFEVKNELAFGMDHQPMGDWYREGDAAFVELLRGPRRVFCFANDAAFAQAMKLASPLYVISRAKNRVIFSNRPATITPSKG